MTLLYYLEKLFGMSSGFDPQKETTDESVGDGIRTQDYETRRLFPFADRG